MRFAFDAKNMLLFNTDDKLLLSSFDLAPDQQPSVLIKSIYFLNLLNYFFKFLYACWFFDESQPGGNLMTY